MTKIDHYLNISINDLDQEMLALKQKPDQQEKLALLQLIKRYRFLDAEHDRLQNRLEEYEELAQAIDAYIAKQKANQQQQILEKREKFDSNLKTVNTIREDYLHTQPYHSKKQKLLGWFMHHDLDSCMHTNSEARDSQISLVEIICQNLEDDFIQGASHEHFREGMLIIASRIPLRFSDPDAPHEDEEELSDNEKDDMISIVKSLILIGTLQHLQKQVHHEHNLAPSRLLSYLQKKLAFLTDNLALFTELVINQENVSSLAKRAFKLYISVDPHLKFDERVPHTHIKVSSN